MAVPQSGGGTHTGAEVPICALGASAGGIAALQTFFQSVRTDLGLAYVVVVHLAPDRPSALGGILADATGMPVETVGDTAVLEPNRVFVVPPARELAVSGNLLTARPFNEPHGHRSPIDHLFESVAATRDSAVAVILSGEGGDGTAGALALREAGGVIFAQDPLEAEHDAMPRAAIDGGLVDVVAPVADLAARLADLAVSPVITTMRGTLSDSEPLRPILETLHRSLGHDFSHYKRPTLIRRIGRRMQLTRSASLADYAALLRSSDEEKHALFASLLISVTAFFRDAKSFAAIAQEAVRPIFDRLAEKSELAIRVWSVGCATGEEAYSLAILLLEEAERRRISVPIQVFATDIDQAALAKAREGLYGPEIETALSPERLKRFFEKTGDGWQVCKELREKILFAQHSVIKDPPFIHLDLVACRNLLIYLDRELQRRVCSILHYALDPGGFLVLGTAETVESVPDLFRPVNREMRIYRAETARMHDLSQLPAPRDREPVPTAAGRAKPASLDRGLGASHLSALETAAPPSVLVGADRRALHLSAGASRFFRPSAGPASLDILDLVRPELRLDLSFALHRAIQDGKATFTSPVGVAFDGLRNHVSVFAAPTGIATEEGRRALVVFMEGGPMPDDAAPGRNSLPDNMRRMVHELGALQERLASSRSENLIAMQELRAANEELQSMNEEYRSTSEELETSKEELQSMNEELQTLNDELKSKLENISTAHNDLRNLVASTDYGILFLDADLRIRLYTPPIRAVFSLAETDVGRPVSDFSSTVDDRRIVENARTVLRTLIPVEFDAAATDGRWFTVRIRPYRTIDDRIDGVVLTFIEVTDARSVAEAIRRSEQRFQTLLRATTDAAFRMGPDWSEMRMLQSGTFLADTDRPRRDWLQAYVPPEDHAVVLAAIDAAIAGRSLFDLEHRVLRDDGTIGRVHSRAAPIFEPDGSIREWFGIATEIVAPASGARAPEAADGALRQVGSILGTVIALAERTLDEAGTPEAYRDLVAERLRAMGGAGIAPSQAGPASRDLVDIVRAAVEDGLAPAGERVSVSGPPIRLDTAAAAGIRLALHELCAATSKRDGWPDGDGRISIDWRTDGAPMDGERRLVLEWRETGSPAAPLRMDGGFAGWLLKERLPGDLGGSARFTVEADAAVYRLDVPVSGRVRDD